MAALVLSFKMALFFVSFYSCKDFPIPSSLRSTSILRHPSHVSVSAAQAFHLDLQNQWSKEVVMSTMSLGYFGKCLEKRKHTFTGYLSGYLLGQSQERASAHGVDIREMAAEWTC